MAYDHGLDPCPFCAIERHRFLIETGHAIALLDAFPVTEGHTLVVPRHHVASIYELPGDEQSAIWALVAEVRVKLFAEYRPDGFNIGLNDGVAAGQTVMHAHIHVIPRRKGDVPDPRGGVRWIMANRAKYWKD